MVDPSLLINPFCAYVYKWLIFFFQAAREEYWTPAYFPETAKEGEGGESLALAWLDEYLAMGERERRELDPSVCVCVCVNMHVCIAASSP